MKDVKFLKSYVSRYTVAYILGLAAMFAVDLINVYIPQFTSDITDGLDAGTITAAGMRGLLVDILLMGVGIMVGRFFWRFFLFGSSRSIERDMRNDMFRHLETLSTRYYNEHKTGDLMAHFTNDLNAVNTLLGGMVVTAFDATVMLAMVLWKMVVHVNGRLTVVAVLPLLLIIGGDCLYGKLMHRRYLAKQEAFSDLTDETREAISGIRVIKAFVQERKELAAFVKVNARTREKNMSVVRLQALIIPIMDLVVGASFMLTLLYGGRLAIYGDISVGQFVAFNMYVDMLVWPMIAVGDCVTYISQGLASVGRIRTIFEEQPEIVNGDDVKDIQSLSGKVELRNLTFAYPDREDVDVLEDINVTVNPGETLAIIGRTGSGKTTLANLMLRLYNTRSDMIRFDGHSIYEVPLETLRRDIAYVPQDSFLFSDTVERNIAFGMADIDRGKVWEAARTACVHDNIMEFPKGYDTVVGERGVTISGGQKQRTSIARAIMKDSPILILDDALSAVDTDTEERILENLKRVRANRTTIIIAHRVSTIQGADHILVLDDGRAAEYGTHAQLMEKGGIYRSIYDRQQLERQIREVEE